MQETSLADIVRVKIYEEIDNRLAVITHYLHNHSNGVSQWYKDDAYEFIGDYLHKTYDIPEAKFSIAADSAIDGLLFEVNNVPFPAPKDYKFKFIDLFAGIGGFRLALQELGGKCVFTSEWDKDAQKTYKANFGDVPFGDITKESTKKYIPDNFDVLCAGFPCQAFSIAGKRGGFEDTRGTLKLYYFNYLGVTLSGWAFRSNLFVRSSQKGFPLQSLTQLCLN